MSTELVLYRMRSDLISKRRYSDSGAKKRAPIREPGVPERKNKKEQERKREKERKPVMQMRPVEEPEKRTYRLAMTQPPTDNTKIQVQKWGVKLMKQLKTVEVSEDRTVAPVINAAAAQSKRLRRRRYEQSQNPKRDKISDSVRLSLLRGSPDQVDEGFVVRPLRPKGSLGIAERSLLKHLRETDQEPALDSEYYVPNDTPDFRESHIWKEMVTESMRRVIQEYLKVSKPKAVETMFIQPEPPIKHVDA